MTREARLKKIFQKKTPMNGNFIITQEKNCIKYILQFFPCVVAKFPVFSLSGKVNIQIPCFPCAMATLGRDYISKYFQHFS